MVIFRCPYCGFETDNAEAFLLHYNWDIPPAPPNRLYGKVYLDGQVVTEGTITPVCIEVGAPTDNPVEIREDRIYVLDIPSRHGCFNCVGKTFKFILTLPDGRQFESRETYKILDIGAVKKLDLYFGKIESKASIVKDLSRYPDGLGGIIYNGQALEPNKEHPVPKGSKVEYFAMAQNVGGPGNIWIRLLVNGQEADRAEGTSPAISGTITVDRDMDLKFEAGHGDRKDDEWGC